MFRLLVVGLLAGACSMSAVLGADPLTALDSPGGPTSRYPSLLVTASGDRYLTWSERAHPESDTWLVLVSSWIDGTWTDPVEITRRRDLFINWADFPAIGASSDSALLVAHWLQKVDEAPYAYHIMFSRSVDRGRTWSSPKRLHDDDSPTEHGFVSYAEEGAGRIRAFWLDGQAMAGADGHDDPQQHGHGHGAMSLRTAVIERDGISDRQTLDEQVCECCGTAATMVGECPLVVYRDRSPDEIRDISIGRWTEDEWRMATPIADDGWRIPGCPVNGPAVAAAGEAVAVAWFTEADQTPRVRFAWSFDGGLNFEPSIVIDSPDSDGHPIGRVDVEIDPTTGDALVLWLDQDRSAPIAADYGAQPAALRMRRVGREGQLGVTTRLATTMGGRASGFPRAARAEDKLLLAWTEIPTDQETRVRVAEILISDIP